MKENVMSGSITADYVDVYVKRTIDARLTVAENVSTGQKSVMLEIDGQLHEVLSRLSWEELLEELKSI